MLRRFSIFALAALLPMMAVAQESAAPQSGQYNFLTIGLVSLMIILLFTIGILAGVLRHLSITYRDKLRQERQAGMLVKSLWLIPVSMLMAALGANAKEAAPVTGSVLTTMPAVDFYFIMGVITLELFIIFGMLFSINRIVKVIRNAPEKETFVDRLYKKNALDVFNSSVAIAEEKTILLDHDYDGIRELDNSLPPWWKWGFAFTIVFAFGYMYYFHMADGPSSGDEYFASVEKAERAKAEYLAKAGSKIDETNLEAVTAEGDLASAKTIFTNVCAPCHALDGGGAVGPNLTDGYWLHGGSLVDVFKSIKYGWKDKGMPEWQHNLSPKQIAGLASYIQSIKGVKTAAPKDPQGVLYVGTDTPKDTTRATKTPGVQANTKATDNGQKKDQPQISVNQDKDGKKQA